MTAWADGLSEIAVRWRTGSIRDLFEASAPPDGVSADEVRAALAVRLRENADLVDAWQGYSYDKRSSPSPYLEELVVGFFDGAHRLDVVVHATRIDACVDFVHRETEWVLHGGRVV